MTEPTDFFDVTHPDFSSLIGKTLDEARELVPGYKVRATLIDGVHQMMTEELRRDRVNVQVRNGKISSIFSVG